MIPLRDDRIKQRAPVVMWTLVALNVIIFLWDRHLHVLGSSITFADLAMRPKEVIDAVRGTSDRFAVVTIFTSMFLHGGLTHLLGNMIFLYVFGAGVEEALGSFRFAVYYLAWGVAAAAAQIWVDPNTMVPTLGASGAIGGVLGAYLLMFPTSKVEIFLPMLAFLSFEVSAWILLGAWFLFQIFFPQQGVANWAHVGGFLAGMLTVLIMGGRRSIIKDRKLDSITSVRSTLGELGLNTPRIPPYVMASLALTCCLSLYSIRKRFEVESENRAVSIAAEYENVESLAGAQGKSMRDGLSDLKAQGLNTVVLNEETIGELINQGKVNLIATPISFQPASNDPILRTNSQPASLSLRFADATSIPRVQRGLHIRFRDYAGRLSVRGDTLLLPPVSAQLIRSTAIGLNPDQATAVSAAGLSVMARCSNPSGATDQSVSETLKWAHELGANLFLPQGDEVLGRRNAIDATIAALQANSMLYLSPEFAKIAGDTEILEKAPQLVVRLHSAQIAELDKLSRDDAIDRYVKAARERNMRALLIRPISFAGQAPLGDFAEFIRDISRQLIKNGQTVTEGPHPYRAPGLPRPFFVLLGLAIAPTVWFACATFLTNRTIRIVGACLLALAVIGCWTKLGQEGLALLGSMAFPILGFVVLDDLSTRMKGSEVANVVVLFALVSAISLVGGLCVAGMLNGLPFYVKAAEFVAVKVSVFVPILAIGLYYFIRLADWKRTLASPITWGASALGLGIGVLLSVMLARTGNDTGLGPSGGEMIFRNFLDRFLYVRPRTKEFLIGHPFLVLGIGMLLRNSKSTMAADGPTRDSFAGWTILALMLGAIGQTSMVNTLCHLHIPVVLSLARDLEGLALGCIIGVVIWLIASRRMPGQGA